jgi:hypothetical protein
LCLWACLKGISKQAAACFVIKDECKKKACMVYYEEGESCSFNSIAALLEEISNQLEDIKEGASDKQ